VKDIDWRWVLAGIGVYFSGQTFLAVRWAILLSVQGIKIPLFQAVKLTYLGLFYNNIMPGAVGGDLLKGWYVTHHCDRNRRVEAAVTVVLDRVAGVLGMMIVCVFASFTSAGAMELPLAGSDRTIQVRMLIWVFSGVVLVVIVFFFNRTIRRVIPVGKLVSRLPFSSILHKIDDAVHLNRKYPVHVISAIFITIVVQSLSVVAVWFMSKALGLDAVTFLKCLIILPVVWLISAAIPVPGGLGITENLFLEFFARIMEPQIGHEAALGSAAALAMLNRLMLYASSMPGLFVPLFGGHLPRIKDLEREEEALESPVAPDPSAGKIA
jgi:hypothetical protein